MNIVGITSMWMGLTSMAHGGQILLRKREVYATTDSYEEQRKKREALQFIAFGIVAFVTGIFLQVSFNKPSHFKKPSLDYVNSLHQIIHSVGKNSHTFKMLSTFNSTKGLSNENCLSMNSSDLTVAKFKNLGQIVAPHRVMWGLIDNLRCPFIIFEYFVYNMTSNESLMGLTAYTQAFQDNGMKWCHINFEYTKNEFTVSNLTDLINRSDFYDRFADFLSQGSSVVDNVYTTITSQG